MTKAELLARLEEFSNETEVVFFVIESIEDEERVPVAVEIDHLDTTVDPVTMKLCHSLQIQLHMTTETAP